MSISLEFVILHIPICSYLAFAISAIAPVVSILTKTFLKDSGQRMTSRARTETGSRSRRDGLGLGEEGNKARTIFEAAEEVDEGLGKEDW